MRSINFDEGYKTYDINGDENRVIRIRVTDPNIMQRYNESKAVIDGIFKELPEDGDIGTEEKDRIEGTIKEAINHIFDSDICEPAFGHASVLTVAENGRPIVVNFIEALLPIVTEDSREAVEALAKERAQRMQKYIDPVVSAPSDNYDDMSREELIKLLEDKQ